MTISLTAPVADLSVSNRVVRALTRNQVRTVGDLVDRTEQDLRDIRNIGDDAVLEITVALARHDLAVKSDPAPAKPKPINKPPQRTTVSANGISKILAAAGFPRATKVPGGRGGVLSPITPGFKVFGRGSHVLLNYLPHDADGRADQLVAMTTALTAAGFTVTDAPYREGLEVRVPERPQA